MRRSGVTRTSTTVVNPSDGLLYSRCRIAPISSLSNEATFSVLMDIVPPGLRQFPLRFHDPVRLDHVAHFHVVVVVDADAALEARLHLAHVVLHPLERGDGSVVDLDAVA